MPRDLMDVDFRRACQASGCPLCFLLRQTEERYLFILLWEGVNDPGIRGRLGESIGFCRHHAWELVRHDYAMWGSGLGTGIIYEDLGRQVLHQLQETERRIVTHRNHSLRSWPDRWRRAIRRWLQKCGLGMGGRLESDNLWTDALHGHAICPLCAHLSEIEAADIGWLIRNYQEDDVATAYQASAGLCLPHLRQVIAQAMNREQWDAALFFVQTAEMAFGKTLQDLHEYLRKFNYLYAQEPRTQDERQSWVRMVGMIAGDSPWPREEPTGDRRPSVH